MSSYQKYEIAKKWNSLSNNNPSFEDVFGDCYRCRKSTFLVNKIEYNSMEIDCFCLLLKRILSTYPRICSSLDIDVYEETVDFDNQVPNFDPNNP